ncbi:hypothetical protein Nepgr_000717 [Nepenthes gracilis]|uniref:Uncharacterized protein n=1 Tax=Nepenthes gracilis TaxID=150966 RepID=A0AAD3RX40_NEPGR|nr:hypothetical protein Nepgr_000717 [Nepenthes gracilis]
MELTALASEGLQQGVHWQRRDYEQGVPWKQKRFSPPEISAIAYCSNDGKKDSLCCMQIFFKHGTVMKNSSSLSHGPLYWPSDEYCFSNI